jgi:membrane protease YdiL (CAAX protease family)
MSLFRTNGPEDVTRQQEAPGSEGTPSTEAPAGQEHEAPPRRIPHLGHALLFVSFTGLLLVLFAFVLALLGRSPGTEHGGVTKLLHPKMQLAMMAATYLTTLLASWFFFPQLWQRTFLDGLQWRWPAARTQAAKLVALGLLLGVMVQIATNFITPPRSRPIDAFFLTQADAWLITLFGTIVAPVFEEICFRGFLLPAFAIAYDWLNLPRTERARSRWQTTTTLTPASLVFSAILTSLFFALMHFQQVAHLWAALLVLFSISLLLAFVRVKTGSVAASVLVHGAYNGFVFLVVMVQTGGYRHLERMMK